MANISQAIKQAAQRGEQLYLKRCTVDSVNEQERTIDCTPIDGGAQLIGVDLQALQRRSEGLFVSPKIGSEVIVGFLDKNNAVALLFTEIKKITLNVDCAIEINGGGNGGFAIVPELRAQLEKMTARIDALYNAVQNSAVGSADGGATFKTNMIAILSAIADKEDFSAIENEKIKH